VENLNFPKIQNFNGKIKRFKFFIIYEHPRQTERHIENLKIENEN
jgi:hypothetical protein